MDKMTNNSNYQPVGETLRDAKHLLNEAAGLSREFVPRNREEQHLAEIVQKIGCAMDNIVKVIEATNHTHQP